MRHDSATFVISVRDLLNKTPTLHYDNRNEAGFMNCKQ